MRVFTFTIALAACLPVGAFAQGGFTGPGRYVITNVKSGMAMGAGRDGTSVVQFPPGSATAWTVESAGSGYFYLRDAGAGYALETPDNRKSTPLRMAPFNGSPNQQWRLERGKDGNALIVSRLGRTIDVPDGSSREGLQLQVYDLNGDSNQRFTFSPAPQSRFGRFSSPGGSAQTFTCASNDGRRNYCAADTAGGVRLTRQISGSPCREGETWGYDRQGIWVDRGCRAEFETRTGYRSQSSARSSAPYTVRCSSDDGRRNFCTADTAGGVRLTRQISGSPCREGETWGFDRRGIWVDRGCRAEFEVGRR